MRDQVQDQDQWSCEKVVIKRKREFHGEWLLGQGLWSTTDFRISYNDLHLTAFSSIEWFPLPFKNISLLTIEIFQIKTAYLFVQNTL